MATRPAIFDFVNPDLMSVQWSGLLQGDDGAWVLLDEFPDRTLQVRGVFGGATLLFQGSNEPGEAPVSPATLTNHIGASMALTAASLHLLAPATRWVRPALTGGDGTTELVVELAARR
jgi:hypothetical protein